MCSNDDQTEVFLAAAACTSSPHLYRANTLGQTGILCANDKCPEARATESPGDASERHGKGAWRKRDATRNLVFVGGLYKRKQRAAAYPSKAHSVTTYLIDRRRDEEVAEMLRIVKDEVRKGRQAFWVCPLVDVATITEKRRESLSARRGRTQNQGNEEPSLRRGRNAASSPGEEEAGESEGSGEEDPETVANLQEGHVGAEQEARKGGHISEGAAVQKFKELKESLPNMRLASSVWFSLWFSMPLPFQCSVRVLNTAMGSSRVCDLSKLILRAEELLLHAVAGWWARALLSSRGYVPVHD